MDGHDHDDRWCCTREMQQPWADDARTAFALSSQIGDRGHFRPGRLNGKRHEGGPSFKPVPCIEIGIGPYIQVCSRSKNGMKKPICGPIPATRDSKLPSRAPAPLSPLIWL